ncbi:MAG: hypothetical protein ACYDAY_02030 [Candidatus Dormibacteria bacterium]
MLVVLIAVMYLGLTSWNWLGQTNSQSIQFNQSQPLASTAPGGTYSTPASVSSPGGGTIPTP